MEEYLISANNYYGPSLCKKEESIYLLMSSSVALSVFCLSPAGGAITPQLTGIYSVSRDKMDKF